MKENKDYELIPDEGDSWQVRILTGDFIETVVQFNTISFNDIKDHLSFNFTIVSSPDIITIENENLQSVCADILSSIIENGMTDGSIMLNDRETGELIANKH